MRLAHFVLSTQRIEYMGSTGGVSISWLRSLLVLSDIDGGLPQLSMLIDLITSHSCGLGYS
jgi:hypothetical protein